MNTLYWIIALFGAVGAIRLSATLAVHQRNRIIAWSDELQNLHQGAVGCCMLAWLFSVPFWMDVCAPRLETIGWNITFAKICMFMVASGICYALYALPRAIVRLTG